MSLELSLQLARRPTSLFFYLPRLLAWEFLALLFFWEKRSGVYQRSGAHQRSGARQRSGVYRRSDAHLGSISTENELHVKDELEIEGVTKKVEDLETSARIVLGE